MFAEALLAGEDGGLAAADDDVDGDVEVERVLGLPEEALLAVPELGDMARCTRWAQCFQPRHGPLASYLSSNKSHLRGV